jgi:hypothetical protein
VLSVERGSADWPLTAAQPLSSAALTRPDTVAATGAAVAGAGAGDGDAAGRPPGVIPAVLATSFRRAIII